MNVVSGNPDTWGNYCYHLQLILESFPTLHQYYAICDNYLVAGWCRGGEGERGIVIRDKPCLAN